MIKQCVAIIYNTIWQNEQNSSTQQTRKYKIKHKTVSVKNYGYIVTPYLEVLSPLVDSVVLGDLRLEDGHRRECGSELGERLATAAADTDEQGVSAGNAQDASYPRQVFQHVPDTSRTPSPTCTVVLRSTFWRVLLRFGGYLFKWKAKGQYWPLTCNTNYNAIFNKWTVSVKNKQTDRQAVIYSKLG